MEKWRRLHNEELHSSYLSLNIVRVIKSKRLIWAGHIARMEKGRKAFKIYQEGEKEKELQEDQGVDGRTIFEWSV